MTPDVRVTERVDYVAMGERALLAVFPDGRLAMSWNARNGGSKEHPVTWHPIPAPDASKLWPVPEEGGR